MATSTAAGGRDIRTEILRTATRLFAARGFDGTSLQRIAEEVGVRKASLLHHFPSKETLRRSVLEELLSHWNEALPRLLMAATATGRFDAVMQEVVRFFRSDPDRARLLVRELLDRPEEASHLLAERVRPWLIAIAELIRRGQAHGTHYSDADAQAYVLHILRLVVAVIATSDTFEVLLPGRNESESAAERQLSELMRVARAGLFLHESKNGQEEAG